MELQQLKSSSLAAAVVVLLAACPILPIPETEPTVDEVGNLQADPGDGEVVLTWTDPSGLSIGWIEVTWTPDGESVQYVAPDAETYVARNLVNETSYTFFVRVVDSDQFKSPGVSIGAKPDITAPGSLSNLSLTEGSGEITLNWTDPADNDVEFIEISWEPNTNGPVEVASGIESYTVADLPVLSSYTFTLQAVDAAGNRSTTATINGIAQGEPLYGSVADLFDSDGASGDWFGVSVAVSGSFGIVGSYGDDDDGSASGTAFIYERDGSGSWNQIQKIVSSDIAAYNRFGTSVAIDGNYAVVGARGVAEGGTDRGAAYIFEHDGSGTWTEVAKLTQPSAEDNDNFGGAVSISGDYVIVGAVEDGFSVSGRVGTAYIFERSGSTWPLAATLQASNGSTEDYFGTSVSIDGDVALVGAEYGVGADSNSGAAYIFTRDTEGNWTETEVLTFADDSVGPDSGVERFGSAVDLAYPYAIVGSKGRDLGDAEDVGAVYIFENDGTGTWNLVFELFTPDLGSDWGRDFLGNAVAITPDYALAAANGGSTGETPDNDTGSVYVIRNDQVEGWQLAQRYVDPAADPDHPIGTSIAADGSFALVGAYTALNDQSDTTGRVIVLER